MLRAALAAALAVAVLGGAARAEAGLQLRPPDGGEFAYETASLAFAGKHVVVHWVARGSYAPALNDDDGNGVPDYVEQVASAADAALDFYVGRGFALPLPDGAGPDSRPDVYLVELPFGLFGYMAPRGFSPNGPFVVLSAHLDRREPVALGSLRATVGHELFHVVQQAYVGELPPWVAEGTAEALAALAAPEAHDYAEELRQTRWVRSAGGPIAENDPYGAGAFWQFLELRHPGLVAALLERRARTAPFAASADPSWYATLDAVFRARTQGSLDTAFGRFASSLVRARVLAAGGTLRAGNRALGSFSPLSIRVLRLVLPARATAIRIELTGSGRWAPHAQLLLANGRIVTGRVTGRSVRLGAALRRGEQLGARLLLTGRALGTGARAVTVSLAAR